MVTPLKLDWIKKLNTALGYRVIEDEESLRILNKCIKGIVQSEKLKKHGKY